MNGIYLDTSAAAKLLLDEAESAALAEHLDDLDAPLVACALLETELRRVAARHDVHQEAVTAILDNVSLYEVPPSLFREAGLLPGKDLRTVDALHLTAALRLGVNTVVAYDTRFRQSARALGLHDLAPGAPEI